MTFVRRCSYLLVVLPLLLAGCGRQPLLDQGGTGGTGVSPPTDGDGIRNVDPDRNDDGNDGDGNSGGGDEGDDDGDNGNPVPTPTPNRPPSSRPPVPTPPVPDPVQPECVEKCDVVANDFLQRCLMRNGDKQACWEERQKYFNECAVSNCGVMIDPGFPTEPLPPMISCQDQCVVGSAADFIGCVQAGRPLEFCAVIAQGNVEGCQAGCGGRDGGMGCEDQCDAESEASYSECRASGLSEKRCEQFRQRQFRDCSRRCR